MRRAIPSPAARLLEIDSSQYEQRIAAAHPDRAVPIGELERDAFAWTARLVVHEPPGRAAASIDLVRIARRLGAVASREWLEPLVKIVSSINEDPPQNTLLVGLRRSFVNCNLHDSFVVVEGSALHEHGGDIFLFAAANSPASN
jgi:hypothetical protein